MRIGAARGLTSGEITIARGLFGESADWPRVRVVQLPALGFGAMVPYWRTILFSRWRAGEDFSAADIAEQAWFAHELAHVWQSARGVFMAGAKTRAIGARAYRVRVGEGLAFSDHTIEGQAEIVRFLYLARARAPQPHDHAVLERLFAAELMRQRRPQD